ncbi:MAG: DUF4190 domain-containing protein [Nitriliruptoraceae bacterium]
MSERPGPEERRPGTPPPPPGTPGGAGGQGQPPPAPPGGGAHEQPPPSWGSGQGLPPPSWDAGDGGTTAPGGPGAWSTGPPGQSTDNNGVALAALVTGIVSLLFAVVGLFVLPLFLSIPGGVVAIVLGVIGRRRANAGAERSGQAVAGLATGIVALVTSAVWIGVLVVLGGQFFSEFSDEVAELEACIEETGDEDLCTERFSDEVFEQLEP